MSNPQLEDGYFMIATELQDALCRIRIPGEAYQVLNVIIRKTYGWKKKEDRISLSQFVELTGINKPCVIRAIHTLKTMNLIVIEKDNEYNSIYCINKKYLTWKPLSKKITLSKKIIGVIEKDNASLSKKIPTIYTTTKDTITKDRWTPPTLDEIKKICQEKNYTVIPETFFNHYEANGWKVGKNKMEKWKAALAGWQSRENKKGVIRDFETERKLAMIKKFHEEDKLNVAEK